MGTNRNEGLAAGAPVSKPAAAIRGLVCMVGARGACESFKKEEAPWDLICLMEYFNLVGHVSCS